MRRFELLYPKLLATLFSHCSLDYFIIHKTWSNLYSLYTFTSISTWLSSSLACWFPSLAFVELGLCFNENYFSKLPIESLVHSHFATLAFKMTSRWGLTPQLLYPPETTVGTVLMLTNAINEIGSPGENCTHVCHFIRMVQELLCDWTISFVLNQTNYLYR